MWPEFDPGAGEPGYLYVKFADHLTMLVEQGLLRPGARLPAERDLATENGISTGTTRRATRLLRERGIVVILPGKGTYITTHTQMTGNVAGALHRSPGKLGRPEQDISNEEGRRQEDG